MRWNRDRRRAIAGAAARTTIVAAFGLLTALVAHAQNDKGGWRGLLLEKAAPAWAAAGSPEEAHQAVKNAIREIDGLASEENNVPSHVQELADSLVMALSAFDGSMHVHEGHPNAAVVAYRTALERANASAGLATRVPDLIDALASAQKEAGDGPAEMTTYDEAIKAAVGRKDADALRHLLEQQGFLCSDMGDLERAIRINERILAMDQKSGDVQKQIGTELSLSKYYDRIGRKEAFQHATAAYKLAEQSNNDTRLLDACDLLISSFSTTSENDECKVMLDRAMAKARERGVRSELARFHDRSGRFYILAGKYDEAITQFQTGLDALDHKVPSDDPATGSARTDKYLAELLLDMGVCHRARHDTAAALMHLAECERLLKVDPDIPVAPWADLGELYLEMGNVGEAAAYGLRALSAAEGEKNGEQKRRASYLLYRVYKRQGNAAKALEMHELFMEASDSKEAEGYKLELQAAQINSKYLEKQFTDSVAAANVAEALRAESRMKSTRSKYLVIGGIILFLGAAVVAFIDRKRRMARFDKEAAQLETQALRSQMNPHFIFNALNSINAFVQKNEPDKAASFLSRFARLMRLVLENSRQSEVPLKDDLDALDAYLHLERARSGEKFDYRIEVAGDIDPEDVMVPPLVAQPFVENAIWHGMSGKEEKGMIKLTVSRKGDQLLFAIEDDGVGRSSPKRMASMGEHDPADGSGKKTSLGTAITKARLDLVRQQKGKAAGFVYVDLPQGTRVELTLPFSTAA